MQRAIETWESVCKRHLHIDPAPLPWVIFYDDAHAWHVNADAALLPPHERVEATLRAVDRSHAILSVAHDKELWLPGRPPLPLTLGRSPYVFAFPYANHRKIAFVIALPSMVRRLPGGNEFPKLEEFFLGLAAHEMVHTRQLIVILKRIEGLKTRYTVPEGFDDNIIQKTYESDPEFKRLHDEERKLFLRAVYERDSADLSRRLLEEGLAIAQARRELFFTGHRAFHADLDDIFLVMEGIGAWVQIQVGRDLAGPEERLQDPVVNFLNRNSDWVQEEGLALFMLIDRLIPDWQPRFLGPDFPSPFAVLRDALRKPQPATKPQPVNEPR